jgi:hypothetical protein
MKNANRIKSLIGILALTSAVACAQDNDLGDLGHDTQAITSEILAVGLYTSPETNGDELEIKFSDLNANPMRMIQQQVTFDPPPADGPFATPGGNDATPWHEHPGWVLIHVVEGQFTYETETRCEVYNEGEVFVEYPNELNRVVNTNNGPSKTHATHLSTSEHPPGTNHEPPPNGGACGFGNQ